MPGLRSRLPNRISSLSCTAAAVVVVASTALAGQARAQAFEGSVTIHVVDRQGAQDMLWSMKGDKARMDISGPRGDLFMLRQGDKMTVVIPAQRMYLEQKVPTTIAPGAAGRGGKASDVDFTGRKERIAGYECEHVVVTEESGDKDDVCLAKGLGTFMMPSNPMGRGGDDSPMAAVMRKLDGAMFPLKAQKVGGKVEMEVTKIEKKSLNDSMFSVPSDYQKFDMSGRMGRPPGERE